MNTHTDRNVLIVTTLDLSKSATLNYSVVLSLDTLLIVKKKAYRLRSKLVLPSTQFNVDSICVVMHPEQSNYKRMGISDREKQM